MAGRQQFNVDSERQIFEQLFMVILSTSLKDVIKASITVDLKIITGKTKMLRINKRFEVFQINRRLTLGLQVG